MRKRFCFMMIVGLVLVNVALADNITNKVQETFNDCLKKDAKACYSFAFYNHVGFGIAKDYNKAAEYYQKACDMGILLGCDKIGMMYELGEGFQKDYKKAIKIYEKTCSLKDEAGCFALGRLYAEGQGVEKNISTAKKYFQKSCDYGEQDACDKVRALDNTQNDEDFMKELEADMQKCENGNTTICNAIVKAADLACSFQHDYACYVVGVVYSSENRDVQNYHKAKEYFQKACDMKFAPACFNLGSSYALGKGARQNLSNAMEYFGKACDYGLQQGCDNYKMIRGKLNIR